VAVLGRPVTEHVWLLAHHAGIIDLAHPHDQRRTIPSSREPVIPSSSSTMGFRSSLACRFTWIAQYSEPSTAELRQTPGAPPR